MFSNGRYDKLSQFLHHNNNNNAKAIALPQVLFENSRDKKKHLCDIQFAFCKICSMVKW